jgi:hypothetical protein
LVGAEDDASPDAVSGLIAQNAAAAWFAAIILRGIHMKYTGLAPFLAAGALLGHLTSARAGAGEVITTVTPLQTNVTYAAAASGGAPELTTYVGYAVTVGNAPGNSNTINKFRFTGTTAVTDAAEQAVFSASDGLACVASNGGTSIECAIGTLRAGQSVSFAVFFKAPQKATNGVADGAGTDFVNFSGTTFYAEGTGGVPVSTPDNSAKPWAAAPVELGTNNPTFVKSAVQKIGGSLFTGSGAAASPADTWTTSVVVPASASYTTAQIEETTDVPLAANLLDRSITTLTIPGSFAKLVITLRRDASTIVKGAKIASARLYYDSPTTPAPGVVYPYEVLPCTDTTHGTLPKPGIPCISRRTEYTKKNAPTPDFEGDWEFEVFALDNGRYVN